VDRKHGKILIKCFTAGHSGTEYLRELAEEVGCPGVYELIENPQVWLADLMSGRGSRRKEPTRVPTIREIHGWQQNLLDNPKLIDYLERERGLTARVIGRYRLGFIRGGQSPWRDFDKYSAFTFPVLTEYGEVVTVRRRFYPRTPTDENGRLSKYASLTGHAVTLYPDLPDTGAVILCAGELDALVGRSNGLNTVSTTCGASLPAELAGRFRLRDVAVIFDAQDAEQKSAVRVVERLNEAGAHAWRVDLRDAGLKDGEDLTDWFVKYGKSAADLRRFAGLRWIVRVNRRAAA
jgi:DNA primase